MAAASLVGVGALVLFSSSAAFADSAQVTRVACSASDLTAAVSGAPSGAVLRLAPGCTYTITAGLTVAANLSIYGRGDTITAGAAGFSILTIDTGVRATVSGLTLSHADSNGNGGAIDNSGTLTVADSRFTDNATEGWSGGAITNYGTLSVTGSTFTGNSHGYLAGAILNEGTITIVGSAFRDNSAVDGGAIFLEGGPATITGSSFTRNGATNYGGAIGNYDQHTTISNSTFTDNSAPNGGAVDNPGGGGGAVITGSFFTGNTATDGDGGALYNGSDYTTTLTRSRVVGNTASDDGGGIYNDGGSVTLNHTLLTRNKPDNCGPVGTIRGCTG